MDSATVVVLIGNSDNKLTQREWSQFFEETAGLVTNYAFSVEFSGPSSGHMPWQNACWVATVHERWVPVLRGQLAILAERWRQDSIAFVSGSTEFVEAAVSSSGARPTEEASGG